MQVKSYKDTTRLTTCIQVKSIRIEIDDTELVDDNWKSFTVIKNSNGTFNILYEK